MKILNIGIAQETAMLFPVKILGAILAFFVQYVMNACIGTEEYGRLSLYLSLAATLTVVMQLGTTTGLVKKVATTSSLNEKKKYMAYSVAILSLVAMVLVIAVLTFLNRVVEYFDGSFLLFTSFIIYLISTALSGVITAYWQGERKTLFGQLFDIVAFNIALIGMVFLGNQNTGSATCAMLVYMVAQSALLIIKVFVYRRVSRGRVRNAINIDTVKAELPAYLKLCVPFCLVTLCITGQSMVLKIIIDANMGGYDVGVFKILETYVGCMALFTSPFITMWSYMAKAYHDNDMDSLKITYQKSINVIALLVVPTVVSMLICYKEVYGAFNVMPENNGLSLAALGLMLASSGFDAIIGPAGALLNMTGNGRANLINTLLSSLFSIVIAVLTIPKYGYVGAALAVSLSRVLSNSINALLEWKLLHICPYSFKLVYFLLSSIPMYLIGGLIYRLAPNGILWKIFIVTIPIVLMSITVFWLINKKSVNSLIKRIVKKR